MDSTLVGALIAAVIALVSLIVNAILESRRGARDLADRQAARLAEAAAQDRALEHERIERRYEDRKETLTEFLAEVDRLTDEAQQRKHEDYTKSDRRGPPRETLTWAEIEPSFRGLQAAQARLELLAGDECRSTAKRLYKAVSNHFWSWDNHSEVVDARDEFLQAARVDLALPRTTSLAGSGRKPSITA